jgi:hypothetical protein
MNQSVLMKTKALITGLFLCIAGISGAQELNCQIDINYTQIQGSSNKQIFDQLKRAVFEFMNNTKWTNESFTPQEKIECSILIIVKEMLGTDEFSGSIQVTSRRPVYKSSY